MIDYVWYDGDIPRPPYPAVGARPVLSGLRATVAEEIALPMEQRGETRADMRERVDTLTHALGIEHLKERTHGTCRAVRRALLPSPAYSPPGKKKLV